MTVTTLVSSTDREAWLEARRQGVTATDAARLARGRGSDRRAIKIEKLTGQARDLAGLKAIDWGNAREAQIMQWVREKFGIEPSGMLVAKGDQPRHLATPDGLSFSFAGVEGAEVKTANHDVSPDSTDFTSLGYRDQCLWNMHVTGAERWLYVWEQHDNNWPDPQPVGEPQWAWIERDEQRIALLVDVADKFLQELDVTRVSDLPPASDMDPDLADAAHKYLEYLDQEKAAGAAKTQQWETIKGHVSEEPDGTVKNEQVQVTWSRTVEQVQEFSEELFAQATANKQAQVVRAREAEARAEEALKKAQERLARAQETRALKERPYLVIQPRVSDRLNLKVTRLK